MPEQPITTQAPNSLPSNQQGLENKLAPDAVFSIVISLVLLSAAIAPIAYACIPKRWQPPFSFKPSRKTPCRSCGYFSSNPRLKCALHPMTVLTEQAVDCTDYCPNMRQSGLERRGDYW